MKNIVKKFVNHSLYLSGVFVGATSSFINNIPMLLGKADHLFFIFPNLPKTRINRPKYIASNEQGVKYFKIAKVISEIPSQDRHMALVAATYALAKKLGLEPKTEIGVDTPAYKAFDGMTLEKANKHKHSKILLSKGGELSLDYCIYYNSEIYQRIFGQ